MFSSSVSRRGTAIAAAALSFALVAPSVSAVENTATNTAAAESAAAEAIAAEAVSATDALDEQTKNDIRSAIQSALKNRKNPQIPVRPGKNFDLDLTSLSKQGSTFTVQENEFVTVKDGKISVNIPADAKAGEKIQVDASIPAGPFTFKRAFTFVVAGETTETTQTTESSTTATTTTTVVTETETVVAESPSPTSTTTTVVTETETETADPTTKTAEPTAQVTDKCKNTLIGFGIPLVSLIPIGLLAQIGLGGANNVANAVNQQIRDFNTEIQRQAGILNPDLAVQIEQYDKVLRAAGWSIGSALIGVTALGAGLVASAFILQACLPEDAAASATSAAREGSSKRDKATTPTSPAASSPASSSATTTTTTVVTTEVTATATPASSEASSSSAAASSTESSSSSSAAPAA